MKNSFYINAIIILLVISLGVLEYVGMRRDASENFTKEELIINAALEVQSYAKRAEGHMGLYLSLDDEIDREKFYKRIEIMNENIDVLKYNVINENDLVKVERIKDASRGLFDVGDALIKIHDENIESFDAKSNEHLLGAIRNSVFIIRENSVGLAQNNIVSSAVGVSSHIKQAESYLLLLYLNLGDEKYKDKYFENLESLDDDLFVLETDVVTENGTIAVNTIKEALKVVDEKGEMLISVYEADLDNFDAKIYEDDVREFHDASSLIRKTGVNLAKEEIESKERNFNQMSFFVFAIILVILILIGIDMRRGK